MCILKSFKPRANFKTLNRFFYYNQSQKAHVIKSQWVMFTSSCRVQVTDAKKSASSNREVCMTYIKPAGWPTLAFWTPLAKSDRLSGPAYLLRRALSGALASALTFSLGAPGRAVEKCLRSATCWYGWFQLWRIGEITEFFSWITFEDFWV